MKIIEVPQYGPMFRFKDYHVYWTLHLLSSGKRLGRKRLAEMVGIGEGSMRRIIDTLRDWEMVDVKQNGVKISREGLGFLNELPIKVLDISIGDLVVGRYQQAILVKGVAHKIENGMQQRDAGIRAGSEGCTTILYRDGVLMMPPDWNLDEKRPELAALIRSLDDMEEEDVIIVGGGDTPILAAHGALAAAFELF
ncbi:MAG: hypothetical protein PWQ88_747 [Candidatus Methanomethylophilaceae archaeon]|nr:MAG: Uncharacterized protein XE14_0068 [Thermoplasmatales archaeon 49_6]MDI3482876.1 hypothetical protein [Candidatus Methanomethylophilaceae archaeon]MDI3541891.1 hypothetical protein [Candidatus Methanomethylophilaceae archaeon]